MSKHTLREHAREIRSRLSREEIAHHSRMIERHLRSVINGENPILVYVSKEKEVDTHELIASLLTSGTGVVVPIIERESRTLRLSYLRDQSVLVVVPMLAFDRNGHRLGYGAGYYDRFLSAHPHMRKIGIAFSCLEVPKIPGDENDVAMDLIVTENGIFEPR
jgi:5-formyltetrahydrofolate cyclo-ligase